MIFNIINSGIISTITVTTAAGASVTCVMSPYSYSATANSSGKATFTVHSKGTWTVTSTKNSISNSDTVSITASGQSKSVSLPLRLWIFKNGEGVKKNIYYTTDTAFPVMSYSPNDNTNFRFRSAIVYRSGAEYNIRAVYVGDKINLSNYSKFVVDVSSESNHSIRMLAGSTKSITNSINTFSVTSRQTVSYNISSLTGEQYIGLANISEYNSYCYNWYLEM